LYLHPSSQALNIHDSCCGGAQKYWKACAFFSLFSSPPLCHTLSLPPSLSLSLYASHSLPHHSLSLLVSLFLFLSLSPLIFLLSCFRSGKEKLEWGIDCMIGPISC